PRQVAVKLKQVDVHAVHRLHTHTDKLSSQLGHVGVMTDDLPVEIGASPSPLAAKDDKQRLVIGARELLAIGIAVDPVDSSVHGLRRDRVSAGSWHVCAETNHEEHQDHMK